MRQPSTIAVRKPWDQPWYRAEGENRWVLLFLIVIHVLAAVGLFLFPLPSWPVLLSALALAGLGGFGTTVVYHRTLAHHALRINPVVEQVLIFFAVFNGSGVPSTWVANHRNHHANADTIDDVSSPRYGGFWWAHLRWLYQWPPSSSQLWCLDLLSKRYQIWGKLQVPIVLLSFVSGGFLGWPGFFWVGAIRLVYCLHMQCFVNSLLHLQPGLPEGVDSSRNIWWLGPLQISAWGENWHRNHHRYPGSARFGRDWRQVDVGWLFIRLLEALGFATDVHQVTRR